MSANGTLLRVCGLSTVFHTAEGLVRAVDGASFTVPRGRTFALVGESGCGKSVTALSILRLIPTPPGQIVSGRVEMGGKNLLDMDDDQIQAVRGGQISMIFQEPMSSLNPVFTCGSQIVEAIRQHRRVPAARARQQAVEMLAKVGIPDPAQRFREYPHQLSGGMRQRVMIAMALCCAPDLLIADEPTTALDVTVQAQILDLLRLLQRQTGMAIILITHDLGIVAEMADEIAVMYAGRVVERAPGPQIFDDPQHPYTLGLLGSIPKIEQDRDRLLAIEGSVPSPFDLPHGCRFHPRCVFAESACADVDPALREIAPGHQAACRLAPVENTAA
jgi:peptide/nickel transport system ATP-binding protein/oligopeptide transport system ATP-binding protein